MANRRFHKKQRFTPDPSYVPPYDAAVLRLGLEYLKLSEAVAEKLSGAGIASVMDVVVREERDFYRISGFDKRNLGELKSALNNRRLRLKPPKEREEKPKTEQRDGVRQSKEHSENGKEERVRGAGRERGERNLRENSGRTVSFERRDRDVDRNAGDSRDHFAGVKKGEERNKSRRSRPDKGDKKSKNPRIWNPDGVSEKHTKEEREKRRPRRPKVEHPSDIYIKINKNNKWGFATRDGKEVIAPEYDDVFTFKEELCCVEREEAFGFIDREGNVVIPIIYECASSFSEGLACVFKGGVCGYIDKTGAEVIPFRYDAGTPVTDGECRVKKAGKWGELHISEPENIRWIN